MNIKQFLIASCLILLTPFTFAQNFNDLVDQGNDLLDQKQYEQANKLFKQACDGGDAMGCNNLGFLYENGYGVKQSKATAKKYYKKSCDLGFQPACAYQ